MTAKKEIAIRKKVIKELEALRRWIFQKQEITSAEYVHYKRQYKAIIKPIYNDTSRASRNYNIGVLYSFLQEVSKMIETQEVAITVYEASMSFNEDME